MPHLGIPGGKELHPVELHGVLRLHLLHVVENTDTGENIRVPKEEVANIFCSQNHNRGYLNLNN
jgi:hypothetical protein